MVDNMPEPIKRQVKRQVKRQDSLVLVLSGLKIEHNLRVYGNSLGVGLPARMLTQLSHFCVLILVTGGGGTGLISVTPPPAMEGVTPTKRPGTSS